MCTSWMMPGCSRSHSSKMAASRTVDAYAVADCEYVLEGYLHPRDRRYETAEAERAGVQG
ncbi:MAG TPA: UbiD family decarboxylase domain-containing protein, partial [Chloroflexota bacterium]|nr:UbiD family decarboxylase domain-containing protein [Chloroflexota bacterium]